MRVEELVTEAERREAVPILRQLWDDAAAAEVMRWTGKEDYHLFGGFAGGELVCVAGVVETNVLHHRPHGWLYDLVVDETRRNEGYGSELVAFVEEWAERRGCERVALASPLSKEGVHDFYAERGYEKWGYVVEKDL